jgi:hypothetical protein
MDSINLAPDWSNYENFGHSVGGLRVDENRFVATMPFSRLERLVSDPLAATSPKTREASVTNSEYAALHDEIQRAFDAGRKQNVERYAQYIVDLSDGKFGDTPSIDLFTPRKLPVRQIGREKCELLWPYDLSCVPYDGETQLAARFRAAKLDPRTREQVVIVTITHGKSVAHGKQCFADRNALQRRASSSLALKMNMRDPLLNVVRAIEDHVPGVKGAIEWEGRQVKPGRVATASGVRTAVACFAHGIAGVQSSKEEELPKGMNEADFSDRAVAWFGTILPGLLASMADRERYVTSSPAVWAALGALGHPLANSSLNVRDSQFDHVMAGLAAKLVGVRWDKGPDWIGLAVKATGTGYSFAGGAKDSGSACYKALADSSEPSYAKIRGMSVAA